ncbi:MAG TPA: hypothetical protein VF581_02565 [Flavobacterium sp.]|jgi:hypothetical protein
MTQKQQIAGRCIFCGGLGLTKQHAWPDWLRHVLPRDVNHHDQHVIKYDLQNNIIPISWEVLHKQGHVGTRKFRNVCKTCNLGWMSNLEEEAAQTLTEMIYGNEVVLNEQSQLALSNWIVMTMIMVEFMDITTQAILPGDRQYLYKMRQPPQNWKIWIGRFAGNRSTFRYRHFGGVVVYDNSYLEDGFIKAGQFQKNVQFSTAILGEFFVHCLSVPTEVLHRYEFDDQDETGLIQIWPPKKTFWRNRVVEINWPRPQIINEEMATEISYRFYTMSTQQ